MDVRQKRLLATAAMAVFLALTLLMLYRDSLVVAGTFLVLFSFSLYYREINK